MQAGFGDWLDGQAEQLGFNLGGGEEGHGDGGGFAEAFVLQDDSGAGFAGASRPAGNRDDRAALQSAGQSVPASMKA